MAGLASNTLANPGNSFYAPVSESAKNWYQFPSLNGSVLLNDASGTQVLQAVQGDLFFNQELLAKAGDIQDITDWALYPALADVDINGKNISDVSGLTVNNKATLGSLLVSNGITSQANIITPTLQIAGAAVPALGQITTTTLAASGQIQAGSVNSGSITGSSISGTSLATSGGLDMINTAITRASSVGISNAGAAPYGSLTSPDGVMLTWNGATITTGAGGNVSQWATFPAVADVQVGTRNVQTTTGNVIVGIGSTGSLQTNIITSAAGSTDPPLTINANKGLQLNSVAGGITTNVLNDITTTTTSGNVTTTAYNSVVVNSGNDVSILADGGLNPLITPAVNLTSQNGSGGQVNLVADKGSVVALGGRVSINANGGTVYVPQEPPAPPLAITVGGEIDINANTGGGGLYTATSAIKLSAAGINSYAGAIPAVSSVLGYNFIYGSLGVSLCAGLPASGFQIPGTTYLYGVGIPGVAGGVRLESPQGIQMLSNTYIENLYPLDGNGLTIQGRSTPTGYVNIQDVASFTMSGAGAVLKTDLLDSVSAAGIFYKDTLKAFPGAPNPGIEAYTVKPPLATGIGAPNLVISGNPNLIGQKNYVEIQNADTFAFDVSANGALTGVKSINGAAWPPSTGDASLWSQYPATSVIDVSGYGLIGVGSLSGVTTINGQAYPVSSTDWSLYPALQNVDISGFSLNNVDNITMPDNAVITAAGQLSIIADVSGSLILATNGGGDLSLSTGNAADIYISTGGAGNNIIMEGDTIGMTATVAIEANSTLDMKNNNINNVADLNGGGAGTDLTISNAGTGTITMLTTDGGLLFSTQNGIATINAGVDVRLNAIAGNINLDPQSVGGAVNLLGNTVVGSVSQPQTLTVNSASRATGDVISSFGGATPYSLNTIGGLVNGISSQFRDATEFYVSGNGSDISGNGSILNPYLTIQKAITQAELISSAALVCVINVASGHYTENLTFNKGYVILNGSLQSQTGNEVCEITGSISIAVTGASDLFNRQVSIQGFNITCGVGQTITDTSTTPHTVSFQDCKAFVNTQFFVSTSSAPDMRLYLTNVEISQFNAASTPSLSVIVSNIGLVELERVDITVDGNVSAIAIGGTSVLSRCSLTILEATSAATTLQPLLSITSTSTATHSLGNVSFAYASAVAKTNTNAINIASSINTAIIMLNCVFILLGTASATNNCVGYNGVGSPTIAGVNNTSLSINVVLPQTVSVQAGIAQISYIDINPPGLATYSSTVDQPIAVSGTPQALTFNTTQFNQGTTLLLNSRVYVNAQGNYNLNYSVELQHTGGAAAQNATTFLKKNGTTIANTGRLWTIASGSYQIAAMAEFNVALNAGDYVEVFFLGDLSLLANASVAGPAPAVPSVVFNIKQFR